MVKNGKKGTVQPVFSAPQVLRVPMAGSIVAGQPIPVFNDSQESGDAVEVAPMLLRGVEPAEVFAWKVRGDSTGGPVFRSASDRWPDSVPVAVGLRSAGD